MYSASGYSDGFAIRFNSTSKAYPCRLRSSSKNSSCPRISCLNMSYMLFEPFRIFRAEEIHPLKMPVSADEIKQMSFKKDASFPQDTPWFSSQAYFLPGFKYVDVSCPDIVALAIAYEYGVSFHYVFEGPPFPLLLFAVGTVLLSTCPPPQKHSPYAKQWRTFGSDNGDLFWFM